MEQDTAKNLIKETFQNTFNKDEFIYFAQSLLDGINCSPDQEDNGRIPEAFSRNIKGYERVGVYTDGEGKNIEVLIVDLCEKISPGCARTAQRNFAAHCFRGKDAGLIAFVSPDQKDWRLSLIRTAGENSPARRYSFLAGKGESSVTAQELLAPLFSKSARGALTLNDLEKAFDVERVTKEFFEDYRELLFRLKESLDENVTKSKKLCDDFTKKNVNTLDFSKRLMGQLIFLYFLQKKGWFGVDKNSAWGSGPSDFLRQLFEKKVAEYDNFFDDILEPLFYEALAIDRGEVSYWHAFRCRIPFLNGGLFEPLNGYAWETTDIFLDNDLFSNDVKSKHGYTGTGILDVFDQYNFTVREDDPLEREVAVDPEMLGKVFENLLEVRDRRSKGAFYTPREIVHYMCQESLIDHLESECGDKIKRADIETLVRHGEIADGEDISYGLPDSVRNNAGFLDGKLADIKICDPAVGSGAFLVGMMSEIIRARGALSNNLKDKAGRHLSDLKRHAIQHSLYGVDIDPGAVEIAKLRLWLSLIVDRDNMDRIEPLPNLDYKIMQGNSLLEEYDGIKLFDDKAGEEELERLYDEFPSASQKTRKNDLKKRIEDLEWSLIEATLNRIPSLDAVREFRKADIKPFFLWKLHFSEVFHKKGGFDVVIANPPYVNVFELDKDKNFNKDLYRNKYHSASGSFDLYVLFHEQSINIARKGGIITLISPNKYLSAQYAEKLRGYIAENASVRNIVDLSSIKIFDAGVYPVISIYAKNSGDIDLKVSRGYGKVGNISIEKVNRVPQELLRNSPGLAWSFILMGGSGIYKKLNSRVKISRVCDISASFSVDEAYKMKDLVSESGELSSDVLSKKLLISSSVHRYFQTWGSGKISYLKARFLGPEVVMDKNVLSRHRIYQADSPKIIIAGMTKELRGFPDISGEYISGIPTILLTNIKTDIRYLIALMNSRLYTYYFRLLFDSLSLSGGYLRIGTPQISQLPFAEISEREQRPFVRRVEKIMRLTRKANYLDDGGRQRRVAAYEQQIDKMVYGLYTLTGEEIGIVESFNK